MRIDASVTVERLVEALKDGGTVPEVFASPSGFLNITRVEWWSQIKMGHANATRCRIYLDGHDSVMTVPYMKSCAP